MEERLEDVINNKIDAEDEREINKPTIKWSNEVIRGSKKRKSDNINLQHIKYVGEELHAKSHESINNIW